jgi:hypothetical protein
VGYNCTMEELQPAAPTPEHRSRIIPLGWYVARRLAEIDLDEVDFTRTLIEDDSIVRINNRFADEELPLDPKKGAATRREPLITDRELEAEIARREAEELED